MIPKKIHYCWFGNKEYPKTVKKCLESWKQHLPDYEFIEWNEDNFNIENQFAKEAYKAGKFAFVSDYVRLYVLYKYGGIYLDTDMFLIENLDDLLRNKIFLGYEEPDNQYISGGIIGAEKENEFIKVNLKYYNDLVFNYENVGRIKIPIILSKNYRAFKSKKEITIYPYDFFYPFPYSRRYDKSDFLKYVTSNTYAVHLWELSWESKWVKLKSRVYKLVKNLVHGRATYN